MGTTNNISTADATTKATSIDSKNKLLSSPLSIAVEVYDCVYTSSTAIAVIADAPTIKKKCGRDGNNGCGDGDGDYGDGNEEQTDSNEDKVVYKTVESDATPTTTTTTTASSVTTTTKQTIITPPSIEKTKKSSSTHDELWMDFFRKLEEVDDDDDKVDIVTNN